jgi:hypothetical protein
MLKTLTLAATAIIFAACGGTPGAPSTGPTASPTSPASTASAGPVSTPTATAPVSETVSPSSPPVDGTASPQTGTIDVCGLLSPEDLNAATGNDYLEGLLDDFGQCYWDGNQIGGANAGETVIGAITPADLTTIKAMFGDGGVDTTVDGHAAFFNPSEGLGSLWVDIGNGQLLVLSFPQSEDLDPSYQQIAEELAQAALDNL